MVLAYDYGARKVLLHDLDRGQLNPHVYAMCDLCAERLTPPRGWYVEDLRTGPPLYDEYVDADGDDFAAANRRAFFETSL